MSDERLLILDDDAMIGETIQRVAEFAGLEVQFTPSPSDFLERVTTWAPTHIALDLVMPEMDGVEVMRQLAERKCNARIIITSGLGTRVLDAAARSAQEHGLDIAGVLSKPFSTVALRQLLKIGPRGNGGPRQPGRDAARLPPVTATMIEAALDARQFHLVYQPKVDCHTGAVAGFEALARWTHPEHGPIGPDRFIPVAEESGLIHRLTEQVLQQGLAWLHESERSGQLGGHATTLSMNLSARSLNDHGLIDRLTYRCQHLGIAPSRIALELTESSAMDDPISSLDLLTRLRMKGFHLSIDDFGTGYSSMVQLVRLPFSEIKVDRSFTNTACNSAESRAVVRSIINLGHSLGIQCTAEGVEDQATLRLLRELSCDRAQGYYIGRPMAADDIPGWLREYGTAGDDSS